MLGTYDPHNVVRVSGSIARFIPLRQQARNAGETHIIHMPARSAAGYDGEDIRDADRGDIMRRGITSHVTTMGLSFVLLLSFAPIAQASSIRETRSVPVSQYSNNWVTSVAVDVGSPKNLYASTAYLSDPPGELCRGLDRGDAWTSLYTGVPWSVWGGSAALEAVGSSLLAGSGIGPPGIYKGTSSGTSWRALTTWTGDEKVRDIQADPSNAARIFAVTEQWDDSPPNLRYSLNGGSNWTTRAISVPTTQTRQANCVAIGATGRILAGCANMGWAEGVNGGGVYISDNLGLTWTRTGCQDLNVTDLAVDPSNPNIVYACAHMSVPDPGGTDGLFKSTNGGASFVEVDLPSQATANTVNVDSLGRVFVGTLASTDGELVQSNNAGASWTVVSSIYPGEGAFTADLDPAGCTLYVGTYRGVSRYWVPSAEELAGSDRYRTAIAVNKARFPAADSATAMVVVSGSDFPDAVVAGPLASKLGGGILLSGATGIDSVTIAEIDRALPAGSDIYIVGGTAAVPTAASSALIAKGYKVTRLGGADRYATSAIVASEFSAPTSCFVANGVAFPDALSASAPASDQGMPILLVQTGSIPAAVRSFLSSNATSLVTGYIAGDSTVVGASVKSDMSAWIESVTQLGGHNRYDTSLAIAKQFYPVPSDAAGIATGLTYPDGLTGSVLCAYRGGPLLLTSPDDVPGPTAAYLATGKPDTMTVFGGRSAIGIDARCELESLW